MLGCGGTVCPGRGCNGKCKGPGVAVTSGMDRERAGQPRQASGEKQASRAKSQKAAAWLRSQSVSNSYGNP